MHTPPGSTRQLVAAHIYKRATSPLVELRKAHAKTCTYAYTYVPPLAYTQVRTPPDTHTTHKHVPVSHRILPTIGDFFLRYYLWFFSLNEYYYYIDIVGWSAVWLELQCSSPIIHHPPHPIHTIHTHPICKYGLCDHIHFAQSHCVNHIQKSCYPNLLCKCQM